MIIVTAQQVIIERYQQRWFLFNEAFEQIISHRVHLNGGANKPNRHNCKCQYSVTYHLFIGTLSVARFVLRSRVALTQLRIPYNVIIMY